MRTEVIHDDDVSRLERRHQHLLDISPEARAIDRAVEDAGSCDAITAERGDKRHCPPVAMRNMSLERDTTTPPAVRARHVGFSPSFVNEDEARGINF